MKYLVLLLFVAVLAGCSTEIAVQNETGNTSKFYIYADNTEAKLIMEFPNTKNKEKTDLKEIDYDDYSKIYVVGDGDAVSGTVELEEGEENVITVHGGKTAPTVKASLSANPLY